MVAIAIASTALKNIALLAKSFIACGTIGPKSGLSHPE
jgi:hypothetical protein